MILHGILGMTAPLAIVLAVAVLEVVAALAATLAAIVP
jgi:hypothetical protein